MTTTKAANGLSAKVSDEAVEAATKAAKAKAVEIEGYENELSETDELHIRSVIRAALTAALPHLTACVGEGWQVVPKEPTNNQTIAALEFALDWMKQHGVTAMSPFEDYPPPGKTAQGMYRAMLSAAPTPEANRG